MARPKVFDSFREVQAEIDRTGSAIFRDRDGFEALVIRNPYSISYIHSYAEDTPFFLGLAEGKLLGSSCTNPSCGFVYATPRGHCMKCGQRTSWVPLPTRGRLHSWTTCHYGSEAFLKETPYNLGLVEFDGAGSLLLGRVKETREADLYVGMPVEARFRSSPEYSITDVWFVPSLPAPATGSR